MKKVKTFLKDPQSIIGLIILAVMLVMAIFAPVICPGNPIFSVGVPLQAPGGEFLLGTDYLGRDVWAMLVWGSRVSIIFAFGASLGAATAPFADDRRTLLRDSLGHLLLSGLLFFLLCALCRFGTGLGESTAFLLGLFVLIYALVWLARWMGWYSDVLAIRDALGLTVPSPLRWRQTLVYAPLLLFLCAVLPVLCRFIDRAAGADVPVFSALVLPFLLLPAGGFCAGLSLGRRAGFCPLFAPAALALYLPAVYLVFNPSALFQAFILFFAALLGTLLGAALRRLGRGRQDGGGP